MSSVDNTWQLLLYYFSLSSASFCFMVNRTRGNWSLTNFYTRSLRNLNSHWIIQYYNFLFNSCCCSLGKEMWCLSKVFFSLCLFRAWRLNSYRPSSLQIIQCSASEPQSLQAYHLPAVKVTHSFISTLISSGDMGALHAKCLFFYPDLNGTSWIKGEFHCFTQ